MSLRTRLSLSFCLCTWDSECSLSSAVIWLPRVCTCWQGYSSHPEQCHSHEWILYLPWLVMRVVGINVCCINCVPYTTIYMIMWKPYRITLLLLDWLQNGLPPARLNLVGWYKNHCYKCYSNLASNLAHISYYMTILVFSFYGQSYATSHPCRVHSVGVLVYDCLVAKT